MLPIECSQRALLTGCQLKPAARPDRYEDRDNTRAKIICQPVLSPALEGSLIFMKHRVLSVHFIAYTEP